MSGFGLFKPGDIAFLIHHDNWISRAMSWFMMSKWSHSFMVIEETDQFGYILETSDFEVCMADLDRYIADPNVTMEVYRFTDLDPTDAQVMMQYAVAQNLGVVYGYLQLISLAIRCLFKRLKINIPNFIRQGLVCDENCLVALSYKVPGFIGVDPKSMDTQDLYEKVLARPNTTKIYEK